MVFIVVFTVFTLLLCGSSFYVLSKVIDNRRVLRELRGGGERQSARKRSGAKRD
jgi:hypothetical protein